MMAYHHEETCQSGPMERFAKPYGQRFKSARLLHFLLMGLPYFFMSNAQCLTMWGQESNGPNDVSDGGGKEIV